MAEYAIAIPPLGCSSDGYQNETDKSGEEHKSCYAPSSVSICATIGCNWGR